MVDRKALFREDLLSQIDREAVGVIELERILAGQSS